MGLVCCIVRGLGGQTNICYNALDRQVERGLGDQIAFYYEGNAPDDHHSALTYSEVLEKVCRLANVLKDKGVKKGDCVGIYMPMVPELPIAMLACARIGAVHSVVFGGFSAEALAGERSKLHVGRNRERATSVDSRLCSQTHLDAFSYPAFLRVLIFLDCRESRKGKRLEEQGVDLMRRSHAWKEAD